MKSILKNIALICVLLFCISGCGGTAETPVSTLAPKETDTELSSTEVHSLPESAQRVQLSLGVPSAEMPGNVYTEAIAQFNETNADYEIVLADYGEDDTALRLELVSGTGPDLILTGSFGNVGLLTGNGALVDMYSYLDADPELQRESFTNLELLECDGTLTAVSPCYQIETYFGLQDSYGESFGWTLEQFLSVLDQASSPQEITGNLTSMNFLRLMLRSYTQGHINYTSATCDFQTPEFEKILEISREINLMEEDPNVFDSAGYTYAELFANYPQVIYPATITGITGFSNLMDELSGVPVTFVGLPAEQGNGGMLRFVPSISICAFSEHPDDCWEFVKYLLTDDVMQQRDGQFPVYTATLETQIDAAISESQQSATNKDSQTLLGSKANGETQTAAISEDEAKLLRQLIFGGPAITEYDSVLTPIVCEEAEAYLSGEKSLGDVIALIENRVRIYLAEQHE